jgi:hypothetical protein
VTVEPTVMIFTFFAVKDSVPSRMTPLRMAAVIPISAELLPWFIGVSVPLRSRAFTRVLSTLPE